ncbi:MAG: tRNA epoxyqueuosine(34) reductase QueG [Sedimentisphaerales bacterium]|nr:tRNA epoxyqueuosine(34) reductase QueG [Sedimentisphaerales bacterium]
MENCEKAIKNHTLELGFDLVGITDASPLPPEHTEYLKQWLTKGYAGGMTYLHRNFDKRTNPALLLDDAKSIICVGLNYKPAQAPEKQNVATFGKMAAYACYDDYHEFIREKLYLLADFITTHFACDGKFKVCVDSVPLAERSLAARAGIGFIAKNHMLTNPVFGQQLFLGELITTLQLAADQPLTNECSGCGRCIKACPTGAFAADGTFDARRCISYLTIEHKDVIPQELADKMGNKVFGCDECALACGRQKNTPASNGRLKFYSDRYLIDLKHIVEMDDREFKKAFADSPLARPGLEKLKRNAVICLQNGLKRTEMQADAS